MENQKPMKKIIIILFVIALYADAYSQDCGKEEINNLKNLILTKAWSENTPTGAVLLPNDPKYFDGSTYYYFDEDGNLRKYVSVAEYPESRSKTVAYYNKLGKLAYISLYDYQPEGYSYQGIAYQANCDNNTVYYKYTVTYDMAGESKAWNREGHSSNFSIIIDNHDILAQYTDTKKLQSFLRINALTPPANSPKIQFRKPAVNDITYINSNNVNLREQASTSSKVIGALNSGKRVKILEVLHMEAIGNLGTYYWYKIQLNGISGYVFGAFLNTDEAQIE